MKKSILMMALLCGVLFCGCKKDKDKDADEFPSIDTVARMMPGTWECFKSYESQDLGYVLEFVPISSDACGGTCYVNGTPYDWMLEPVYRSDFEDNVKGCATSLIIGGRSMWWFVYSISKSEMEWRLISSDGGDWNDRIGNDIMKFRRIE